MDVVDGRMHSAGSIEVAIVSAAPLPEAMGRNSIGLLIAKAWKEARNVRGDMGDDALADGQLD